jgi:DNA-binding response OmpR family regulator
MKEHHKILIVEDDLVSAEYLKEILKQKNYDVIGIINSGAEVIKQCRQLAPDIILMDIMLKDNISGSEAALKLYSERCPSKVIFVTAYADDEMIDYAAQSHAYGYILKPYREEEIFATIKLALSHDNIENSQENPKIVQLQRDYTFDLDNCKLYKGSKEIPLAKKKRKLIEILVKNKNRSVSNEQICRHIWGSEQNYSTLRSLIYRIRAAIGEDIITNVNGLGYMIH